MKYEAYIDGSYKKYPNGVELYSSATIIAAEGTSDWASLTQCGNEEIWIGMHNVAGELVAAIQTFKYCIETLKLQQGDELRLNYDYKGIHNWLRKPGDKDYWRQNTPATQAYRAFYLQNVAPRFKVTFRHTPGHSGILGNDIVDKLAKETMQKHYEKLIIGG